MLLVPASLISICIAVPVIAVFLERIYANRRLRLGRLICRYNDYELARRVFRREIWKGQTESQLIDSRGEPANKDRRLATPWRETWTYPPRGFVRGRLQVTLEEGHVLAWESTGMSPVEPSGFTLRRLVKREIV